MMNNFNVVVISGIIFDTPETTKINTLTKCSFKLLHETQRKGFNGLPGKIESCEIPIVLWGPMADQWSSSLTEGATVLVKGRLKFGKINEKGGHLVLADEIILTGLSEPAEAESPFVEVLPF